MTRLEGKIALISGGARGQGAAEAKLFASEGAKVVLGDILEEEGKSTEAEINASGGDAKYIHLDVTKEQNWKNAVEETVRIYGKLNILVNNAGILLRKGVEETSEDVNSKGVFLGTKAVIPAMRKAGGGSIVNISSVAGLIGSTSAAYGASKGAVRLLTKSTAVQYGPEKIRCNSVHPGLIDTDMVHVIFSDQEKMSNRISITPLGTFAEPKDVAFAVLFLASDESRFVTGSELVIDGGTTAQ